jgi:predicted dehydrogenase
MNESRVPCDRREFGKQAIAAGAVLSVASAAQSFAAEGPPKRIRAGVIGCGSVSHSYLPVLAKCPFVQLVSTCDIRPERAKKQAERFRVPHHYPHIDAMLTGEPFDFLIDLTDMQEHEKVNRRALEAGKHVWS